MKSPATWTLTTLLLLTPLAISATGCSEDGDANKCAFNEDCATPEEYCDVATSTCKRHECFEDAECTEAQRCNTLTNRCVPRQAPDFGAPANNSSGGDMGMSANNNTSANNANTATNNTSANSDTADNMAPSVLSVTPAPGAEISEEGVEFSIVFSEPMDPISISPFSILLEDALGGAVELEVTYDEAARAATATPTARLEGASRYTLTINRFSRDVAENVLDQDYTYDYFTPFEEDAGERALAERWAPVIYQEIAATEQLSWRWDMPGRVDFDGDWEAADNLDEAIAAVDYPATVYYHVTESSTQIFIFYILYYPARVEQSAQTGQKVRREHDFTGAVFVVDKETDALVLVEGLRVERDTDTMISYLNSDGGMGLPGEGRIKGTFSTAELEGGRRYPLYVPAERHEACNWLDPEPRPPFDTCVHPRGAFAARGAVLRPGEQGQSWEEGVASGDNQRELTYALASFAGSFWARRDAYGPEALYERGSTYTPDGMRPSGVNPGEPLLLPNRLASDDPESYGKAPFQWLELATRSNGGQWLLDPAWSLAQRYSVPDSMTWSQQYCANLFFGVDQRGQASECPDRTPTP